METLGGLHRLRTLKKERKKMNRLWRLVLGGLLLCPQSGFAADPKEEVTYIHTNLSLIHI